MNEREPVTLRDICDACIDVFGAIAFVAVVMFCAVALADLIKPLVNP